MVLTATGLLQIAGSLAGSPFLIALGVLSGAAPLPRVFGQQQGIETFARRARLEIETASGDTIELPVDRAFGGRLRGPTVRVAAYGHAALFAGLPGSEARRAVLGFGLCEPGVLVRELGLPGPVTSVRVWSWSELAEDEPLGELEIDCRPQAPRPPRAQRAPARPGLPGSERSRS